MRTKSHLSFIALFLAPFVYGCGPWLPEAYLLRNDDFFYAPPELGFAAELKHLLPESVPHEAVLDGEEAGGPSSEQELSEALKLEGVEEVVAEAALAGYKTFRSILNEAKLFLDTQPYPGYWRSGQVEEREAKLAALRALEVPENLPKEFRLYSAGALAYYRGNIAEARGHWNGLLELPIEQRHYRSVMAAFMLARTCPLGDPSGYEPVRALAEDGFADRLGLAAASYGRQAQLYLKKEAYLPAIELYYEQWASGYWNAVESLELTAKRAFAAATPDDFSKLLENEKGRAVFTAYLLTHYQGEYSSGYGQRLVEALPDPGSLKISEAGRFALLEYQEDNLSAARLWLSYAGADDALALWVRSKLLLRAGKIDEGRTIMLALTESFKSKDPDWRRLDTARAWGELGLLYMREERYKEAADAFWNAQSWQDCAYVLERVLATEDLLDWLNSRPDIKPDPDTYRQMDASSLVARRLMREARFEEALELFDVEVRPRAEDYLRSMKAAHNDENEASTRARYFWEAARIMRNSGIHLFGAELAPDYVWLSGQLDLGDLSEQREEVRWTPKYQINAATSHEGYRSAATRIQPDKRFHYRYRAVQLAELAAGLLPNNDEDAARIYVVSASWIQKRDPAAADRLFKQLAVRCPQTELGKAALEVNWFPKVNLEDYEPFTEAESAD